MQNKYIEIDNKELTIFPLSCTQVELPRGLVPTAMCHTKL